MLVVSFLQLMYQTVMRLHVNRCSTSCLVNYFNLDVFLSAGVVDEDYRGNVGVVLFNFSKETFEGELQHQP